MKDQIATLLTHILQDMGLPAQAGVPDPRVEVEVPEDPAHGDYTTNVAMKIFGSDKRKVISDKWKSPMDIALQVKKHITSHLSLITRDIHDQNIGKRGQKRSIKSAGGDILSAIDRVEVAPPGFINVFLSEASLITQLQEVLKQKESFGKPQVSSITCQVSRKTKDMTYDTLTHDARAKRVMVEFAHPNTHKAFHIGHLRNISTGESIIRLLEFQGHTVIRANYQGDVGMHIAKALYALLHLSPYKEEVRLLSSRRTSGSSGGKTGIQPEKASPFQAKERVEFLGKAYAAGSKAFEAEEAAKEEIVSLNALIYASAQKFARERGVDPGTTDYLTFVKDEHKGLLPTVYELWKETRQWSLDYFETIYQRVGSRYDRYYFESECLAGVDLAREALKKGVLKKDAGAIIFDGKPYGLDTRVFVNNLGLPTYEGKELKLATMETTEHGKFDRMIHVVGPEQASFFKVTFKAEEILGIVRPGVQHHLIYGWVKLKHGKMSSRSGNVVLGEWLLDEAKKEVFKILDQSIKKYTKAQQNEIAEKAAVAAVKYAFLKVGTTSEIAFDIEESVNFQGDSGPYLQYTYARCRSVLRKAAAQAPNAKHQASNKQAKDCLDIDALNLEFVWDLEIGAWNLNAEERSVLRLLTHFPDVASETADTFSPSTMCTYLFRLAQAYNLFYAKHQILSSKQKVVSSKGKKSDFLTTDYLLPTTSKLRLALTAATAQVLKTGLYLLGIEVLEQM